MSRKLIKIDELTIGDHSRLSLPEDSCFYLGEYTAHKGYGYSETNQLILNFKKPLSRQGKNDWPYKEKSIKKIALEFRAFFEHSDIYKTCTFVPIPPSKEKTDPAYDDRVERLLQKICEGHNGDVRDLIKQTASIAPFHEADHRLKPEELSELYVIDERLTNPPPHQTIILFDDVLTTGCHFKACKRVLQTRFPHVNILGLFIARRKPENPFEVFEVIED